jgi:DNA-binding CsgD family transcriptional regulator
LSKVDLIELLDLIDAARTVGTEQQFKKLFHLCSRLVPLDRVHVSVATLDARSNIVGTTRQININYPTQWLAEYRRLELAKVDPAAKMLFRTDRLIVWADLRRQHKAKDDRRFFDMAGQFGLHDGFSFGARFASRSNASFFTCEGDGLTGHRRHVAIVEYLLPHLHAALSKVHLGLLKEMPVLTEREREVLRWTQYGKTNAEIALQMNVSGRTVKFHIENAIRKLQANNRTQATAIALAQGLIDWG